MSEKTYVEDIDRSVYDIKNEEKDVYRVKEGLTPAIVEQISKEKKDPQWMQLFRLNHCRSIISYRFQTGDLLLKD